MVGADGPPADVHKAVNPDGMALPLSVIEAGIAPTHELLSTPALMVKLAGFIVMITVSLSAVHPVLESVYKNLYVPAPPVMLAVEFCVFVGEIDEPAVSAVQLGSTPVSGIFPTKGKLVVKFKH